MFDCKKLDEEDFRAIFNILAGCCLELKNALLTPKQIKLLKIVTQSIDERTKLFEAVGMYKREEDDNSLLTN